MPFRNCINQPKKNINSLHRFYTIESVSYLKDTDSLQIGRSLANRLVKDLLG